MKINAQDLNNKSRKLERLLLKLRPLLDLEKAASTRRAVIPLDDGSRCTIVSARDQDGDVTHYLHFWSEKDAHD